MKNKKVEKKNNSIAINARTLKLLYKKYPQMIISTILNSIWTALTPYVGIYLSALIIEELAGARNIDRLKILVLITVVSLAVIALISALIKKWNETQTSNLYFKFENFYTEKLFKMDFVSLDDIKTHELLSTVRQNQNGGGWGLYRAFENYKALFSSVFTLLGGLALTITLFSTKVPETSNDFIFLNHPLFIIGVIILMILVTLLAPYFSYKGDSYYAKNANLHNLGNRMFSFFGWLGHNKELATDVRMYRQDLICDKYNRNKNDTFASNGLFAKLSVGPIGLYSALSAVISAIFIGLVYLFVCLKSWAGAFGVGMIMQYISSITKVSSGLNQFVGTIGEMKTNSSFLSLFFEFLDIPNTMYQGSLTVEKRLDRDYEIEFKNVSFKYQTSNDYVLKDININFKVGSKLAIVGMNGSGKTTFIKLLCRLYDPTEGEILLNGIDIKKYNYLDYLMIFSIVFQDFKLLALKLGENVASGTKYDSNEVIDCLVRAGYDEGFRKMNNDLDTYLYKNINEKGVNISGGEAQKIAIARALYKDSPFIILDEPTASLDPIAEAEIYSKFNEIVGDKTAIYISHRLSSCVFCDEVVVFDNGRIVQHDTHKNLLKDEKGKYFELWNAQAQYYK